VAQSDATDLTGRTLSSAIAENLIVETRICSPIARECEITCCWVCPNATVSAVCSRTIDPTTIDR
jgi:hypothetical protein